MDSNKSIDGLRTRRAKTSASSTASKPSRLKKGSAPSKRTTPHTANHPKTTRPLTKTTKKPGTKHTQPVKANSSGGKTPKILDPTINPVSLEQNPAQITERPSVETDQQTQPIQPPLNPSTSATEDFLKPTKIFKFDEESGELKASNPPEDITSSPQTKKKKAKKPVSKKRKIIRLTILAVVLLLIGAIVWLVLWGNDIIAKITGGQGTLFDLIGLAEPTYTPLKTDQNGRTNILAFGTSGYNMEGDEGNGTHDGAQLTDSIMIISFDQETKDVVMLSLPRDLKASPTCTATGKINEVYWCNDGGKDGSLETETKAANALMEEVGNILGIDFQYYAHLNWGSLVQIVDTLGGIKVTLDEDILDYGWTGAVFKADTEYTINGEQALGLARARHGTASGDFSRGASQQKILIGIKDKVTEKGLSIPELMNLASTLGDNLRTNFSIDELKTLAHLASETDLNTIRQISLLEPEPLVTTGNINNISYVIPVGGIGYYAKIRDYIEETLSNDPRVYEDASILILNGTETAGLAASEQNSLTEDGYKNTYTDNAPTGTYLDQYTLYALDNSKPGTKKLLEEKYSTTSKSYDDLPAGIPTNYDFVLVLGSPE